jgi:putative toxin-antitoxin system antitoxin component (TIGR02293 family)
MAEKHQKRTSSGKPIEAHQVFIVMGSSLGLAVENVRETVGKIRLGLGIKVLDRFQQTSLLSMDTITRAIRLPKSTMVRRRRAGKLSSEESERLVRLSLVFEKATNLFDGDKAAARHWLSTPCKGLGNQAPLAVAETELGARAVEDLIGQLEHGVFV